MVAMSSVAVPTIPAEYAPLPLASLRCEAIPAVDLYLPVPPPAAPPLYREAGTTVSDSDLRALRTRGVEELWISGHDEQRISDFLRDSLATILADENQPPRERLKLLNHVVSRALKDTLSCEDPSASVAATQLLAQHLVTISLRSDMGIRDVAKVVRHDFCTFTHSANVACFSTLLARSWGITDEEQLREIAAAGMLHDLGKLEIPNAILAKPGRLSPEEFTLIKLHPTRGFQMLRDELTPGQLMMVYQHHEKLDGKGYPVGCEADEIHEWAKICAVVDVFEALTGKRPYRRGNSAQEALTIMNRGSGSHFDAEMLRCWASNFRQETAP